MSHFDYENGKFVNDPYYYGDNYDYESHAWLPYMQDKIERAVEEIVKTDPTTHSEQLVVLVDDLNNETNLYDIDYIRGLVNEVYTRISNGQY